MPFASVAFACAALIGFAAHRASLCNVRTVAEIMTSGSAHMLWSQLQAVLWMATLTGVMALVFGIAPQASLMRMPQAWSWADGLPTIKAAAFAGYLSMLVGIALVLGALRATHAPMSAVACSPAGCEEASAATLAQPVPPDIRQGETA